MSKIVLYSLMSLDGAVEDPHRYFPETEERTGPPVFDDELEELEVAMMRRTAAVLLGRGMYDQWSRYWPTSDAQPFAGFINAVKKYVVTSTPLTPEWAGAVAVAGPLREIVEVVKQREDGDVYVHGSITLARSLLAQGLVDELCLAVGRVLDPRGPRLFERVGDLTEMQLIEAVPTSTGTLWLRYALTRSGS